MKSLPAHKQPLLRWQLRSSLWHAACYGVIRLRLFVILKSGVPDEPQVEFAGWMFALALLGVSTTERPAAAASLSISWRLAGLGQQQVAIDKGWIKDAGLDVTFQWFDYSAWHRWTRSRPARSTPTS